MSFTTIRNWPGSSNRDELYRLCDENGIARLEQRLGGGAVNDDLQLAVRIKVTSG